MSVQFYQCCYEPEPDEVDGAAEFFGPRLPNLDQAIGYAIGAYEWGNPNDAKISINLYEEEGEEKLAMFIRHVRMIDHKGGPAEVRMPTEEEEPTKPGEEREPEYRGGTFIVNIGGVTHMVPAIIAPDMVMCGSKFLPGVKQPDLSTLKLSGDDEAHLLEVLPYCVNEGGGHDEAINNQEIDLSIGKVTWSFNPTPKPEGA